MKAFFEEYGRAIMTVLVILGIILVGYVIAGNGAKSALGRFTANVTDSLSRQANNVLESSLQGWKASHPSAQNIVRWDSTKIFKNGVASTVKWSVAESNNPMHGCAIRAELIDAADLPSGPYTMLNVKTEDGSSGDTLQPGKHYSIFYYVRGKGKWLIGPEQDNWNSPIELKSSWMRINRSFKARPEGTDTFKAFIMYGVNTDGKFGAPGNWCEVSDVYISEER